MSDAFFTDLRLPAPQIHLGVGSGSHAEQTGNVMIAYEKVILEKRPDLVIVVGIQEETTYLGIPCLTMRPNTERPVTVTQGTNRLCSLSDIQEKANDLLSQDRGGYMVPEFWDGNTATRVVESIKNRFVE